MHVPMAESDLCFMGEGRPLSPSTNHDKQRAPAATSANPGHVLRFPLFVRTWTFGPCHARLCSFLFLAWRSLRYPSYEAVENADCPHRWPTGQGLPSVLFCSALLATPRPKLRPRQRLFTIWATRGMRLEGFVRHITPFLVSTLSRGTGRSPRADDILVAHRLLIGCS